MCCFRAGAPGAGSAFRDPAGAGSAEPRRGRTGAPPARGRGGGGGTKAALSPAPPRAGPGTDRDTDPGWRGDTGLWAAQGLGIPGRDGAGGGYTGLQADKGLLVKEAAC